MYLAIVEKKKISIKKRERLYKSILSAECVGHRE